MDCSIILKKLYLFFLSFFYFFCLSHVVQAKEIFDMSLEDLLNIEVITVSKRAQSASDAPATIHVVTDKMIHDRGYFNLQDLLEDIPEIEIQKKSHAERNNLYTLRGTAGNEKFIVLIDGFRINSPTGTPHVVGANYSLVDAKRVEVILGPASALYGVDAFTGIINIITKTGEEIDGGNVTVSYGQNNTTENSFVYGKKLDNLSFLVSGHFYYSDEPDLPEEYKDFFSWYHEHYKTNGEMKSDPYTPDVTINVPIEDYETPTNAHFFHTKLNFENFEFGFSRNFESHSSSIGRKPDYSIYSKDAIIGILIQSFYGSHNYQSSDEKWSLQTSISHAAFEMTPDSMYKNNYTGYENAYKYASNKTIKFEEQFSYFVSETNTIIFGVSYEDISAQPISGDLPFKFDEGMASDSQGLYYLGTNITDNAGNDLTVYQDLYNLEYQNFGTYLQWQCKFADITEVTLGVRYDYNTRYGSTTNPRAGVVISPTEKLKFKLLYGEAYLAPSPFKAYQHYGSFASVDANGEITSDPSEIEGLTGTFWHLPNPDLEPEQLSSYEGSVAYFITPNISVSLNGYYIEIDDLIVTEMQFDRTFKGIAIDAAEIPVNKGSATTKGGTLRLNVVKRMNEILLNGYAAYSYSDGDIQGETLPFSAENTVKAGIDLTYKKLSVSPRIIYRSESYHPTLNDEGNNLGNHSYTIVNLFIRYKNLFNFDKYKNSLFLRVDNLTNEKHYNVSNSSEEGQAMSPQDPIRFLGGLSFEL